MKTSKLSIIAVVSLIIFGGILGGAPSFAQADHVAADNSAADARVWAVQMKAAGRAKAIDLVAIDLASNVIPSGAREKLISIADEQAQIWGDTILESDFVAENKVNVDSIESVHMGNQFLGYRITYSSTAFATTDCDAEKNLSSCKHGRIVEATFVSPSLLSWIRDENAFAEFVAD